MGLEILARDAAGMVDLARKVVEGDEMRKLQVRRRVQLYYNDYKQILRDHLYAMNPMAPQVAAQLELFIPFVGGSSFMKRMADTIARPLYARDAMRRVVHPGEPKIQARFVPGQPAELPKPSPDQEAWEGLIQEMDANRVMDQGMRLSLPSPKVFLYPRVVKDKDDSLGTAALDLLTADMVTVIPDPRRPTKALALIYGIAKHHNKITKYMCWDESRYFSFSAEQGDPGVFTDHDFGLLPFPEISQQWMPGVYWPPGVGADVEAQTLSSYVIDLVILYQAWTQRHIQLAFKGDMDGFPQGQVFNEKSVIIFGGADANAQLIPIDLRGDPGLILKIKSDNEASVAANYGISRDRLNQKGGAELDDGLHEHVAEMAQSAYRTEAELFRVGKQVFREHPRWTVSKDAQVLVDLGYVHNRTKRDQELKDRAEEKRQGIRSPVDDVLEDNPEFGGDRARALAYLEEKARERAITVELQRALNAPHGEEAGMSPEENGAMGPAVREANRVRSKLNQERGAGMSGLPAADRERAVAFLKKLRAN